MIDQCEAEILSLHRFFERWLGRQKTGAQDELTRLMDVLSERFMLITPGGERQDRRAVLEMLRDRRGVYGEAASFGIRIEGIENRYRNGKICLMSYEEWHEIDGDSRGRLSTALFKELPNAPNGVEWLHLHETWLP